MKLNYWIAFFILIILLGIATRFAMGADLTVIWNPNSESDLAGYKVHYGETSKGDNKTVNDFQYDSTDDVGLEISHTITGLLEEHTYYIALTAYDEVPNESGYSSELSTTIQDTTAPNMPEGVRIKQVVIFE